MGILEEIVNKKKDHVQLKKHSLSFEKLNKLYSKYPEINNLESILEKKNILISEMKRKSPSGGILDKDLIPRKQADLYIKSGTDAISVLTEKDYFSGSNDDLNEVLNISKQKKIPVLQKDFIIDEYQIFEAKQIGADSILLIIRILSEENYVRFYNLAESLGLSVIVEIHNEEELELALKADINILGINNRNLDTLTTNLETFEKLSRIVPKGIYKIAESGIRNSEDATRMINSGANGLLVGESIIKSNNIQEIISEIASKNV